MSFNINSIMGVKRVSGLTVKGKEILAPSDIAGLRAWYKWKTGITVVTGVSQWLDQSANGFHLNQATTAQQPAYDSTTGKITPDGSNDNLFCSGIINDVSGEITVVLEVPASPTGNALISKSTNTSGDFDALSFFILAAKTISKNILIGTGVTVTSITVLPSAQKMVVSFAQSTTTSTPTRFFVNSTEVTYSARATGGTGWRGSSNPTGFYLFRNFPTPSHTNVPIYEWCWHSDIMNAVTRQKLVNYFRTKHGF